MAGKLADLNGEVEPIAADTKRSLLSLSSKQPFPKEYRPPRPPRSVKIPKTKPARGLEKFDPFHSMPQVYDARTLWWWRRRTSKAANKLDGYFGTTCGSNTSTSSWDRDCRIRWAGRVEEERGRRLTKWRFLHDANRNLTTKAFQTIEKTVRNSFAIKQSYAYQLRNIETGNTKAYYQNRRSPWFDNWNVGNETMVGRAKKRPAARLKI